jgi:adenine deaminase
LSGWGYGDAMRRVDRLKNLIRVARGERAPDLETSGASLSTADLKLLRRDKRVLDLAEMMNYPGVLRGINSVLEKLTVFRRGIRDGHAPLLSGRDLNAYLAAGIRSDHECTGRIGRGFVRGLVDVNLFKHVSLFAGG